MGKNGQDAQRSVIRDLTLRRTAGSPPGLELVELAGLAERARRHGNDPYASLRPAFHQLVAVRPGSRLTVSVDFTRYELSGGAWLWIRPGQVQRWGTDLTQAEGLVIAFPRVSLTPRRPPPRSPTWRRPKRPSDRTPHTRKACAGHWSTYDTSTRP
ncbi:hypothetical protein ACFQ3Z_43930 [Streptomyces nogalater]